MEYLEKNHLVKIIEEEYQQFARFYSDISQYLNLSLTNEEVHIIAYDRTYNMNNYIVYPDAKEVLTYFTFEPHISIHGSKYGFKKENIYYFQNGKPIEL